MEEMEKKDNKKICIDLQKKNDESICLRKKEVE